MAYSFGSELKAHVVQMIMKFWGINTSRKGRRLMFESGEKGFEFFARLYDGI